MTGTPWIVLPTYDEADNLPGVVRAIRRWLPEARVLVVDDSSPDGTAEVAERLGVDVLRRPVKQGLGPAYVAGFARAIEAGAQYVFEMDADGSHDPADLPRLLAAVRDDGADLALGSRYVRGGGVENWHWLRRAVSRAGCLYARLVLRVPVRDLTGGFKCFRAETLRAIDFSTVRSRGYAFQVELTYRTLMAGRRVHELPIVFHERREGQSKMTGRIALEAVWLLPRLRAAQRRLTRCR